MRLKRQGKKEKKKKETIQTEKIKMVKIRQREKNRIDIMPRPDPPLIVPGMQDLLSVYAYQNKHSIVTKVVS